MGLFVIVLMFGITFRFAHLSSNAVWDEDALIYQLYAKKYARIVQIATAPEFHALFRERATDPRLPTFVDRVRDVQSDARFQAMASTVPTTDTLFPDWVAKPAFIMTGALFHALFPRDNSLLFLTALFGAAMIPLTFLLSWQMAHRWGEALLAMALVALSPMLVGYSRTGHANMAAVCMVSVGCLAYIRGWQHTRWIWSVVAGGCFAGALAFHPSFLPWIVLLIGFEFMGLRHPFGKASRRIGALLCGAVAVLLCVEIGHLVGAIGGILFAGAIVRPFLFSMLTHGDAPTASHPWFYISAMTLYEGGIFICIFALSCVMLFRVKDRSAPERVWLFLCVAPLLLFSVASAHVYVALRNMVGVMVPAYLVIAHITWPWFVRRIRQRQWAFVAGAAALIVLHAGYAVRTNWANARYDARAEDVKAFVQTAGAHIVPVSYPFFLENLLHRRMAKYALPWATNLFFYLQTDKFLGDNRIVKVFTTTVYDRKLFGLETPQMLSLFFDRARRQAYNRIFLASEPL